MQRDIKCVVVGDGYVALRWQPVMFCYVTCGTIAVLVVPSAKHVNFG